MSNNSNDKNFKHKKAFSTFLTLFAIFMVARIFIGYIEPDKVATLTLISSEKHNVSSLGNNVRVSKVVANKGTNKESVIPFSNFELNGTWALDTNNNLLTCYNPKNAYTTSVELVDCDTIHLDFISEVGSGIVKVQIDNKKVDSIDLYTNNDWSVVSKDYDIDYPANNIYNILELISLVISIIFLAIAILFFVLSKEYSLSDRQKSILDKIKNSVNIGFFVVVVFVLVASTFQSYIYKNTYDNKDTLTITATCKKDNNALANNVRISRIVINDNDYDFSKIELTDNWQYSSTDHLLYVYDPVKPSTISIPLENVRTVEVEYVQEVGSGIAEFAINNKVFDTANLYKNCQWDNDSSLYKASSLIQPFNSYFELIFIFAIFSVVGFWFVKREKYSKLIDFAKFINIGVILTTLLYILFAIIQRESLLDTLDWIGNYQDKFFEGLLILVFLNMILSMILGKNFRSFLIIAIVGIILLLVNYFKIQFRDTPLLPWDFMLISVAGSVVSKFKLTPSVALFVAVLITIIFIVVVKFVSKKFNIIKIGVVPRIATTILSIAALMVYVLSFLFNTSINLFDVKSFYSEEGFVLAFTESMQYINPVNEPDGYSKEKMEEIYNQIISKDYNTANKKPNVILIMSESFWDITRVKELGFEQEMFPTYKKLQNTSITGNLLTNVYNGGTVNSEFEAITGFSVAYLPAEYMPYQRCMRPNFFSINSFFKNIGYDSLAIHPFEKSNYNRNNAYEYLGFDKALWEEDFDDDADRMRTYISDHALTQKIIEEYNSHKKDSDKPWFNLSISMQNHGGYWESSLDPDKKVSINDSAFSDTSKGSIEDLATGLHYADLALGELIDYFKTVDDDTVIIMFGDHMSNAGPIGDTLLDQSSLLGGETTNLSGSGKSVNSSNPDSIYEQRLVPFMAWSNFDNTHKQYGTLSVTQLLPTVFSDYNIEMPTYFKYLKSTQPIYTACASGLVVNSDGTYDFVENMTEEQKQVYQTNWLIEYDYIFGENYLQKLFEENK